MGWLLLYSSHGDFTVSFLGGMYLCHHVFRLTMQQDIMENKRRAKIIEEMGMTPEQSAHQGKINGESDMTDRQNIHFKYSM